ncbi:hypothetical protein BJ322DRAFT_1106514 [Thelephora terrestris]|uniref:F-box domain-containing protein n=1 Tax=Thelephora terrestris TaxID=56493 RepID=A0A9P6HJY5_9AGAM|nr:hypothetical protein BJ322DRAFT_1106514 [Thelephora terrestris]
MTDITRRLPPELLLEIFVFAPVPDILKLKQVNRIFRDILASPLIQHKIDLFTAGLEHNAEAGISLADSQEALLRYRSSLDSLSPAEVRAVNNLEVEDLRANNMKIAGGVCAIIKDPVRLFTLGSASRGILHKEWAIPLPVADPVGYGFYPGANVITFVELQTANMRIAIHLNTLSDGEHHPAAQCPIIHYSHKQTAMVADSFSVSITSSRLAILASLQLGRYLVVLDWKSAQVLFELNGERYNDMEFIDDYRLLASINSTNHAPSSLEVMDTGKDMGGVPMQTFFHLSPCLINSGLLYLLLERGVHEPSPAESLAPFHQDPTQRVIVLDSRSTWYYIALPVRALLGLLENREGSDIAWDEWKGHAAILSSGQFDMNGMGIHGAWVSGCRFFSAMSNPDTLNLGVYDFSMRGRAKYLSEQVNEELGGVRYFLPSEVRVGIPWNVWYSPQSGHDSIVFPHDPEEEDGGDDPHVYLAHIWTF